MLYVKENLMEKKLNFFRNYQDIKRKKKRNPEPYKKEVKKIFDRKTSTIFYINYWVL